MVQQVHSLTSIFSCLSRSDNEIGGEGFAGVGRASQSGGDYE